MDPEVSADGDAYFDPSIGMVVTHSGRARWRKILAEHQANRDPQARARMLESLGMDPNRPVRRVFRATRPSGYAGVMRRPDIELTDEAAAFVERHPDIIARLARQSPPAGTEATAGRRQQIRGAIRERLSAAQGGLEGAGQAFLARYAGR